MASANLKNVAVRFNRSLMLKTGKKINHLDSEDDDLDENENHFHDKQYWINVAKKTLTNSSSFTLLKSLILETDLNGEILKQSSSLNEFKEKEIFHVDDDFELTSHEHSTVLFR